MFEERECGTVLPAHCLEHGMNGPYNGGNNDLNHGNERVVFHDDAKTLVVHGLVRFVFRVIIINSFKLDHVILITYFTQRVAYFPFTN